MNADTWSREAIARLSDTRWRRIPRARRWLLLGAELALVVGCAAGLLAYLAVGAHVEAIKTDAAKMRAEAAEMREAIEYRRCEAFPNECKMRTSVFYQRPKVQPEKPTKRR